MYARLTCQSALMFAPVTESSDIELSIAQSINLVLVKML